MVSSLLANDPVRTSPDRAASATPPRGSSTVSVAATHPVLSRAITPSRAPAKFGARGVAIAALDSTVQKYCGSCHNPTMRRGNLNLRGYSLAGATESDAT